jgi:hypothetical protein
VDDRNCINHTATPASLQAAAPHIGSILSHALQLTSEDPILSPRANIKWSKISINGIYTGMSKSQEPYTSEECHTALTANNPTYATLTVTQLPSWVQAPSSYNSRAISSLSVAFEDQDGTKLKALLAERYLYCFGTRGTMKKWKCRRNLTKATSAPQAAQHTQASNAQDSDEDVKTALDLPKPRTPPLAPRKCTGTTTGQKSAQRQQEPYSTPFGTPQAQELFMPPEGASRQAVQEPPAPCKPITPNTSQSIFSQNSINQTLTPSFLVQPLVQKPLPAWLTSPGSQQAQQQHTSPPEGALSQPVSSKHQPSSKQMQETAPPQPPAQRWQPPPRSTKGKAAPRMK